MTVIPVIPQEGPGYQVVIGAGVSDEVSARLEGVARVAVFHAAAVTETARRMAGSLERGGARVVRRVLPDGEAAKDIGVATRCWDALGEAGFTRTDTVVGVGGGAVTDLAGFVAATWLRGVPLLQVPTTTAGMVDAAIGGKTGINTPTGKNLVGAFHQPTAVLCDLGLLATLPREHHAAGLAEVVKCGFIADPVILDLIESDPAAALDPSDGVIPELVERAVAVKAEVVSADTREAGRREILNYGHTLGHAIERAENYRWRHGDAVSVGMVFAAALGRLTGRLDGATASRHADLLGPLGLPVRYAGATRAALTASMRVDKKARADRLRFIVLDGLARPGVLENPGEAELSQAFAAVGS